MAKFFRLDKREFSIIRAMRNLSTVKQAALLGTLDYLTRGECKADFAEGVKTGFLLVDDMLREVRRCRGIGDTDGVTDAVTKVRSVYEACLDHRGGVNVSSTIRATEPGRGARAKTAN
jgi:hypothetical protein